MHLSTNHLENVMNLDLAQARIVLHAVAAARLNHISAAKQHGEEPETTKMDALIEQVTEFLDMNTPYGQTLDGTPWAYVGQRFAGIYGGERRKHNLEQA